MIVRLRRARGLLALCAVPPGLVWAGLVAVSVVLHSSADTLGGSSGAITRPHLHQLSLSSFDGVALSDGACAACALEGNPAAGTGLSPSVPEPLPAAREAIGFAREPHPRTPSSSVLSRAPPRS